MEAMGSREAIHALVDEIPESELPKARRKLEEIRDNGVLSEKNTADEPSALARAEAAGLVGCVKGGPPDLAANPAHMAGYGK